MQKGKTREQYENILIEPILEIKRRRKEVQEIKRHLFKKHKILDGNVQQIINNPKVELSKLDWRVLLLMGEQVYAKTNKEELNPENFYTENEIKKAKQYIGTLVLKEDISLPYVFEEVIRIDYNKYLATIDVKTLAQMSSLLLNYNFDIQREAKKRVYKDQTIREATLIMKNVLEIKENLKRESQEVTNIVINASVGTSDSGEEITYNPKNGTLTINEGTRLDIVDGYHRCKASELAYNENPEIDFKFGVLLLNYTDDQAAKYQGQLAKATPITKSRQKQLAEDRHADIVANNLINRSELRGRVATSQKTNIKRNELVNYETLSNTIDSEFKLERMYEVHKVSDYLINYFDYLIGYYSEQFIDSPAKYRRETLMLDNIMFIGYIVLAKRMMDANIEFNRVIDYIDNIDFNRDNKMWFDLGVLDERNRLTSNARLKIKEYFYSISLN